jgi:hypothetical protein
VFLKLNALDGLLGAKTHVGLDARADVAHFDLNDRIAFAGNHDFAFYNGPQLVVVINNVAFAESIGVNLHFSKEGSGLRNRGKGVASRKQNRNICVFCSPSLLLFASGWGEKRDLHPNLTRRDIKKPPRELPQTQRFSLALKP